jgi:hypothetical protein
MPHMWGDRMSLTTALLGQLDQGNAQTAPDSTGEVRKRWERGAQNGRIEPNLTTGTTRSQT